MHPNHRPIYASIGLSSHYAYLFVLALGLTFGLACFKLAFKHTQRLPCIHVNGLWNDLLFVAIFVHTPANFLTCLVTH